MLRGESCLVVSPRVSGALIFVQQPCPNSSQALISLSIAMTGLVDSSHNQGAIRRDSGGIREGSGIALSVLFLHADSTLIGNDGHKGETKMKNKTNKLMITLVAVLACSSNAYAGVQ